jgi:hypothetical protein
MSRSWVSKTAAIDRLYDSIEHHNERAGMPRLVDDVSASSHENSGGGLSTQQFF